MKKNVKLWGVFLSSDAQSPVRNYLSIVTSEKLAIEYITKRLIIENADHYSSWCKVHDYEPNSSESYEKYIRQVIAREDLIKYSYCKIVFNEDEISSLVRIALGCRAIGCSYETAGEAQIELLRRNIEAEGKVNN